MLSSDLLILSDTIISVDYMFSLEFVRHSARNVCFPAVFLPSSRFVLLVDGMGRMEVPDPQCAEIQMTFVSMALGFLSILKRRDVIS